MPRPDPNRPDPSSPETRRRLQDDSRRDVKPLLEELRLMIRRSELSQRQVEEMAGFSRGYLSQLLAQNLDLKVWHLLAILEIFGEHPGDFFHRLSSCTRRPDALAEFAAQRGPQGDDFLASIDRLYRVGVDSLATLRKRLERMEGAVDQLESQGLVEPPVDE